MIVLVAEIRRTFRLARSYWVEYVSDFVLYVLAFLFLTLIFRLASDSYNKDGYLSSLLGYITWYIGINVMSAITQVTEEESHTGTLEQLFLTGLRPGLIFLNRAAGSVLERGAQGLLIGITLATILGILHPISPLVILVFLLTLLGATGFGFALAGLVLVYKRLDLVVGHLWQALLFFTGALAPIYQPVLLTIARVLPLSWGINCLRSIYLNGATISMLGQDGLLVGLLLNTAAYVTLGYALFSWGQRRARKFGTLAHY